MIIPERSLSSASPAHFSGIAPAMPIMAACAAAGLRSGSARDYCRRRAALGLTPAYRRNAARTAAAVELKYSGGSMKPHSLNLEPLATDRR